MVKHVSRSTSYGSSYCKTSIILCRFKFLMKRIIESLVVNNVTVIKVWCDKDLQLVINAFLDNRFCNLCKRPILLFILLNITLKCFSNVNRSSRGTPKCFQVEVWEILYSKLYFKAHLLLIKPNAYIFQVCLNSLLSWFIKNEVYHQRR